jgi:hypothetical protein
MTQKVFCFDIDNTLCGPISSQVDYSEVEPIKEMISFVNELYNKGHIIYLYTGRHTMQALVTNKWLEEHQVKYHHLYLGKPVADVYIDDLAIRYRGLDDTKNQLNKLGLL